MIEHNLLSASKLYTNIRLVFALKFSWVIVIYHSDQLLIYFCSFDELGALLGIDPRKVSILVNFACWYDTSFHVYKDRFTQSPYD